jgi:hypothetical protein
MTLREIRSNCGKLQDQTLHASLLDSSELFSDFSWVTLVFYRKRAFESGGWQEALARFRKNRQKEPLAGAAGAAGAAYGFSIDFRLKIIARSGIRQKRCY